MKFGMLVVMRRINLVIGLDFKFREVFCLGFVCLDEDVRIGSWLWI